MPHKGTHSRTRDVTKPTGSSPNRAKLDFIYWTDDYFDIIDSLIDVRDNYLIVEFKKFQLNLTN